MYSLMLFNVRTVELAEMVQNFPAKPLRQKL